MNDWIGSKSNMPPPSAEKRPSLPVHQPAVANPATSARPKSGKPQVANSRASVPKPAKRPPLPVAAPVEQAESNSPLAPKKASPKNDPIPPVDLASESELLSVFEDEEDQEDRRWFTDFAFFYGMPSWMVSFVFHLILIISLALFSFSRNNGKNIEFVMANEPMPNEIDTMDVSFDLSELETETEDLEQESEIDELTDNFDDSLESELEELEPNQLADQLDAIDALNSSSFDFKRGDGKGASFFGTGAVGTQFVFVVDCSGSMEDEYRWIMAKRELKEAILGLTKEQQFFVFLYNDSSFAYTKRRPKLMNATKQNKEKIFKWLDKQSPIGDTRPWRAMKSSLGLKPNAIFFLSDGELKDDTVVRLRDENVERVKNDEKIGKIPIHTISLGSGFGAETMRAISEQNDGTFTRVNTW